MDPLALLEAKCLQSRQGADDGGDGSEGTPKGEDSTEDDAGTGSWWSDERREVVAQFSYPTREPAKSRGEALDRGTESPKRTRRGRSRSRERRLCGKPPREETGSRKTAVEPAENETKNEAKAENAHGYQMSAIDSMILRQEALLMRQSAKFLRDVKEQRRDAE